MPSSHRASADAYCACARSVATGNPSANCRSDSESRTVLGSRANYRLGMFSSSLFGGEPALDLPASEGLAGRRCSQRRWLRLCVPAHVSGSRSLPLPPPVLFSGPLQEAWDCLTFALIQFCLVRRIKYFCRQFRPGSPRERPSCISAPPIDLLPRVS